MDIPLKQLKHLLKTLEEGKVNEFEFEDEKHRIRVSFGHGGTPMVAAASFPAAAPQAASPAAAPALAAPATAAADDSVYVTSPFVGTFYRASSPEGEPFVNVGTQVTAGKALCIVEAMKLMNEIEAEFSCTILEILVENGKSVEFGQKLFRVKK
ncbi:MAG: acetyl-CoA carboxylase biotin carboxyl carrier protein [Polyangiaceae bacterium]|nr:acetyl-CoA carboxylase biotin carboxyl carrier protein [Polyangiaceae bacterium]